MLISSGTVDVAFHCVDVVVHGRIFSLTWSSPTNEVFSCSRFEYALLVYDFLVHWTMLSIFSLSEVVWCRSYRTVPRFMTWEKCSDAQFDEITLDASILEFADEHHEYENIILHYISPRWLDVYQDGIHSKRWFFCWIMLYRWWWWTSKIPAEILCMSNHIKIISSLN